MAQPHFPKQRRAQRAPSIFRVEAFQSRLHSPPLLQCRAFPPVDQLLDTRCAVSLVLISTQTPCKAVFSLESGNRAQNRALEEAMGTPNLRRTPSCWGQGHPHFLSF